MTILSITSKIVVLKNGLLIWLKTLDTLLVKLRILNLYCDRTGNIPANKIARKTHINHCKEI